MCGYDGAGGTEYATPENGFWVADGHAEGFAHALHQALTLGAGAIAVRVQAGQATAAAFSEARFQSELGRAWETLLGDTATHYRLPPDA